ncbi:MAG: hypothetical protein CR217_07350 [Beijerinckiaceae bacterium]|nr:MAG: hypothetical protein CR217_07350 [Beijerinckiaceae bacterium]
MGLKPAHWVLSFDKSSSHFDREWTEHKKSSPWRYENQMYRKNKQHRKSSGDKRLEPFVILDHF